MKKFTFKGVLDGFRQQVQPQMVKPEQEIPETLRPEHFQLKKVSEINSFCHSYLHICTNKYHFHRTVSNDLKQRYPRVMKFIAFTANS